MRRKKEETRQVCLFAHFKELTFGSATALVMATAGCSESLNAFSFSSLSLSSRYRNNTQLRSKLLKKINNKFT